MNIIITIILAIATLFIGLSIGYILQKRAYAIKVNSATDEASSIVATAKRDAENVKKETLLQAQKEAYSYRNQIEDELKQRRDTISKQENRLAAREDTIDRKDISLDQREKQIRQSEQQVNILKEEAARQKQNVDELVAQQEDKLYQTAQLSKEDAEQLILTKLSEDLRHERATLIQQNQEQIDNSVDKHAKNLLVQAIQKGAAETVAETTVSVVNLPNDEMKGRIIGREGRNIRSFEALTGIDLIIDDTPEVVVLSGFDPIRREIAKRSLEKLIEDGRIHPARIEEIVDKSRKDVNDDIYHAGEHALIELGIHNMHPDLIKIVGRLNYRTSYGQNVLNHSIEVAQLAGNLAAELNLDEQLAKRAGLLHDIGKAIDHELEGSHVEIGVELTTKYHEPKVVVNAIASHHGDIEPTSFIALLVQAADTISSARPGARSESLENYVRRLEKLEAIANNFEGVKQTFAIQAGREIRVMVSPEEVSDDEIVILSHEIRQTIENQLEYPGNIKVTVIREKRAIDYAK
ncbi:ribonuclease Y [Holzapfeliella floricola]|uniref:Ribonuclease Y n=1 Tax=Holzapfeliella floricola DSM 23037 = JCM 16512 TaxID=1423744 RepID=A0A0R2DQU9_9LACO|nr:ribonuclease Y [Holzapfeliella floricola]KRN04181.1 YmdA YtgF family protein [Holzapfeliella floricola DSM 23037 = JCM 16512]